MKKNKRELNFGAAKSAWVNEVYSPKSKLGAHFEAITRNGYTIIENLGFSVYPNPFFINEHGILNHDGHVRFIYYKNYSSSGTGIIDIYDFNMNLVIGGLSSDIHIGDESIIIWNGRDLLGNKVVNGTYFCKLSLLGSTDWTKLLVIN